MITKVSHFLVNLYGVVSYWPSGITATKALRHKDTQSLKFLIKAY